MKSYFFGYLFVRAAKLLAALIFLAGLALGIFSLTQASLESSAASYRPSGELGRQVEMARRLQSEAQQILGAFRPRESNAEAAHPAANDLQAFVTAPPASDAAFERLDAALLHTRSENGAMKDSLLNRFETLIAGIRSQLLAHAQEVTPAPVPEAASPSSSAAAPTTPAPFTNGLYSPQISDSEFRERAAILEQSSETLRALATQAERAENKQTITSAVAELDGLVALLPSSPAPSPTRSVSPALPTVPVRRTANAEIVALRLQQLTARVRQSLGSSWASTEALDRVLAFAHDEQQKCRSAGFAVRRIWQGAVATLLTRVLAGVFLAFMMLAATDLTKALLDSATHSGIVADAYRGDCRGDLAG